MRAVMNIARLTILCAGILTFGVVTAQDTDALAKAAQNPISSLISLPFQWNSNFEVGPLNKPQHVLNIQPVYPLSLNDDWNLITRTILPVISQPAFGQGQGRETGLGDIQFTAFFSADETDRRRLDLGRRSCPAIRYSERRQAGSGRFRAGAGCRGAKNIGPVGRRWPAQQYLVRQRGQWSR